jgi:hypothetical protein
MDGPAEVVNNHGHENGTLQQELETFYIPGPVLVFPMGILRFEL